MKICVERSGSVRERRLLRFDEHCEGRPLGRCELDGAQTTVELEAECWTPGDVEMLRRELRSPRVLADRADPSSDPRRAWMVACLYLALHEELRRRGELERRSDEWTEMLLWLLRARAGARAVATVEAGAAPWHRRCREDLLDAAAAVDFFASSRMVPFAQWLSAVLGRGDAAEILDGLLPAADGEFVRRVLGAEELRGVVLSVAKAQRREWFLGRYDLRGAATLHGLIARLEQPRFPLRAWVRKAMMTAGTWLIPRLSAGCLVGILPFALTDEAWRLAGALPAATLVGAFGITVLAVFGYLFYDHSVADPAHLVSRHQTLRVGCTGVVASLALAAGLQCLAAPSFLAAAGWTVAAAGFDGRVFLASAAFSLCVGVFTQLIWQDRAVTAPP